MSGLTPEELDMLFNEYEEMLGELIDEEYEKEYLPELPECVCTSKTIFNKGCQCGYFKRTEGKCDSK